MFSLPMKESRKGKKNTGITNANPGPEAISNVSGESLTQFHSICAFELLIMQEPM